MRRHPITCLRAAVLVAVVLLGPLLPIAGVQASGLGAARLPPSAQPPVVLGLDDGLAEVLVSETLVLLVGSLGCGLLVVGLEVLDLCLERRQERNGPRMRVPGSTPRGTLIDA